MFLSDQPIQSSAHDIIGRKNFAHSLAETILTYESANGLVLGLYGEWGAGKTSLLNLVVERIHELSNDNPNSPIIVNFNPWNFSEQNQLLTQYFLILSGILKRKDNNEDLIKIGKKLEDYSGIFEPLTVLPVIGVFTFVLRWFMKLFGSSLQIKGESRKRNLDELKEELNNLLLKLDQKIIVIIDDIDRLAPNEIRQIFQLVKKIADFPNIIYLLAFDKKVVLNALKEVHVGFENEYLEKIIQVPFEIPPISKSDLYDFLSKQIDIIIEDLPQKKFDQTYWANIFHGGYKFFFTSIRDVTRYINTLAFNYGLVKNEVNVVDFIAITAIQVFHSELYHSIKANKDLFAGYIESSSRKSMDTLSNDKEFYESIIPLHKNVPPEKLKKLLSRIFPKLETVFGHTNFGESSEGSWRKNYRICSEDHFDTYFRFTFNASELTQNEMERILAVANDPESFRETLIKLNNENRILKFLELFEDYSSDLDIIPVHNIQNIITVIMDIGDSFPEKENESMFEFDTGTRILRIFFQLSHRFTEYDKRFSLFKNAIENCKNSIFTIVHEIGVQDQQHEKPDNYMERTVTREQLNELHELAYQKIIIWTKKQEFLKQNHLGAILYRWKEWKGIDEVRDYINKVILNDEGKINIVRAFLGRSVVYGASGKNGNVFWKINLKDLSEFIDPSLLEPRLREIKTIGYLNCTEKEKIVIDTFLDFYDGKRQLND